MNINKTMEDSLNSLKDISKKCHDILCGFNEGAISDIELVYLIFSIRDEAAKKYNQYSKELGLCDENYDLINEFND